jgi:hypothetical protein
VDATAARPKWEAHDSHATPPSFLSPAAAAAAAGTSSRQLLHTTQHILARISPPPGALLYDGVLAISCFRLVYFYLPHPLLGVAVSKPGRAPLDVHAAYTKQRIKHAMLPSLKTQCLQPLRQRGASSLFPSTPALAPRPEFKSPRTFLDSSHG